MLYRESPIDHAIDPAFAELRPWLRPQPPESAAGTPPNATSYARPVPALGRGAGGPPRKGSCMSRYERKTKEGAAPFLEDGEEVLASMVARPRGWTQSSAGAGGRGPSAPAELGARKQGQLTAAREAGFEIANPMALTVTAAPAGHLKIGSPLGWDRRGREEPGKRRAVADVDSIEVKRLAIGKTVTVTVRGLPFTLEVNAAADAKGVAEAVERAKGASRQPPRDLRRLSAARTGGGSVAPSGRYWSTAFSLPALRTWNGRQNDFDSPGFSLIPPGLLHDPPVEIALPALRRRWLSRRPRESS